MSAPKLFISYCWSSSEHEAWVLRLGEELRENGVDAKLDKWDLKEGNDAVAFMEQMVTDNEITKVILVIDEYYSDKANKREGGVGIETQIISSEIYERVDQNKFVAVIARKEAENQELKLPAFYKSRIYIDLSDEQCYNDGFEKLLRWIYDKPLHIKPELGKKPAFLDEEKQVSLGTSFASKRLLEAIRNNRLHVHGALEEYLALFSNNLERFRLEPSKGVKDFDEQVVESIEQFIPARNELIDVFITVACYANTVESLSRQLHKFFESLISYLQRPKQAMSYHEWDWDNLKFIIHECFLLCIAVFLKYEKFDLVAYLLHQQYYIEIDEDCGDSKMVSFGKFRNHLDSLEHRNKRLELGRTSIHADLIKERCVDGSLSFRHVMQADFILYVTDAIDVLKRDCWQNWWPVTLVYSQHGRSSFEIFMRSESTEYFSGLAQVLGIQRKNDLDPFENAIREGSVRSPRWHFHTINVLNLMNFSNLCSRP